MSDDPKLVEKDLNEDPITGEHGSHPVGTGLGAAAAGAAAGLAGGAVGGPVGAAVGAVVGGVAGGLGGSALGEMVDPTVEHAYWEGEFHNRDYVDADASYETYRPAYEHGFTGRVRHDGTSYADAEATLQREWNETEHSAKLGWDKARYATRDAWHHVERHLPGDADGDGR